MRIILYVSAFIYCGGSRPSGSQTPGLECTVILSSHCWVMATDGEKKGTIFHSTQSVVNWNQWGWIVWLKFDRITDDQQWQQTRNRAPHFEQTKPLSALNVFQRGQENGSLLILMEIILKSQLFFFFFSVLHFNFDNEAVTPHARPGYLEKTLGEVFCARVLPRSPIWLQCLCLISCSRRTWLWKDQRGEAFKDPEVVEGSVLCLRYVFSTVVVQRGRFVLLDADQGVGFYAHFVRRLCEVSAWTVCICENNGDWSFFSLHFLQNKHKCMDEWREMSPSKCCMFLFTPLLLNK